MAEDNRNNMSDAEDFSGICFESLDDKYQTDDEAGKAEKKPENDIIFHSIDDVHHEEDEKDEDEEKDEDAVPFWSYLLHIILFTIPVIGVVFMLIYIIGEDRNRHLKKLALIWLFVQVAVVLSIAAAVSFVVIRF